MKIQRHPTSRCATQRFNNRARSLLFGAGGVPERTNYNRNKEMLACRSNLEEKWACSKEESIFSDREAGSEDAEAVAQADGRDRNPKAQLLVADADGP